MKKDIVMDLVTMKTKQVRIGSNIKKTTVSLKNSYWVSVSVFSSQLGFSLDEFFTMLDYYRRLREHEFVSRASLDHPRKKVTYKDILDEMNEACALGSKVAEKIYLERDDQFFVNENIHQNWAQINTYSDLIKHFSTAPADNHSGRISLDLYCSYYDRDEDDPLFQIFSWIEKSRYSPQKVIKTFYGQLLASNVPFKDLTSNDAISKYILSIEKYKPFGWTTSVFVEVARIHETGESFNFLTSNPKKRVSTSKRTKKKIVISLNDSQGEMIFFTSHILCEKLRRSKNSFFKMLSMYYFAWIGAVEINGEGIFILSAGWEKELKNFFVQSEKLFI